MNCRKIKINQSTNESQNCRAVTEKTVCAFNPWVLLLEDTTETTLVSVVIGYLSLNCSTALEEHEIIYPAMTFENIRPSPWHGHCSVQL